MMKQGFPEGVMRLVGNLAVDKKEVPLEVPLFGLHTLYETLGLSDSALIEWQDRYGVDSLGLAPDGSYILPAYPTFSKIVWMHVDPVDLDAAETKRLINECDLALSKGPERQVRQTLCAIRTLASESIQQGGLIEFGHV